jgi:hypothetical protein
MSPSAASPIAIELLSPAERLAEIGEILARGLVRFRARQSSQIAADPGESSLEPVGHQSGHANPEKPENGR